MISVIIPTYKSPQALDLCLQSACKGQRQINELIVVVDGYYDLNKEVLDRYEDNIKLIICEQNQGLCHVTNVGVQQASADRILIVNDDNVFPDQWDDQLNAIYRPKTVFSPNQIEPFASMFRQFHIQDIGRDPVVFPLQEYWDYEKKISKPIIDDTGSTLPIFMTKQDFLDVDGWDENYEQGLVADWDFFLKCQLAGLSMLRSYHIHFYHFVSLTINTSKKSSINRDHSEKKARKYAIKKWGRSIKHNPLTNLKFI